MPDDLMPLESGAQFLRKTPFKKAIEPTSCHALKGNDGMTYVENIDPIIALGVIFAVSVIIASFLYQNHYSSSAWMLAYLIIAFFIISLLIAAFGLVVLGFGDETLRRAGVSPGIRMTLHFIQFALALVPFIVSGWFAFSRSSLPLGVWTPVIVLTAAPLLMIGTQIVAESMSIQERAVSLGRDTTQPPGDSVD